MRPRLNPAGDRLPAALRPSHVSADLATIRHVDAAERELRRHAQPDDHRCWGYFPSLTRRSGIHVDLPACQDFAAALPEVTAAGTTYRFSFLRMSLVCQSQQPACHLDSDAATALTGDPATLGQRLVGQVLLNLSATEERILHYPDLDVSAAALTREGSYVRATGQAQAVRYARHAAIPPRSGRLVHGISFIANRVLHSGVDGPHGHFVAAYGYDRDTQAPASAPQQGCLRERAAVRQRGFTVARASV
jgi:hypothetical protein